MQPGEPLGRSDLHRGVLETLEKVADTDIEILICGPSGVGKELYAGFVHRHSRRRRSSFVPVNCGSLSGGLLENQLFGHVGGAFTGARAHSEGLVSEAEGGTLFLDEVDSLSVPCQVKLLRFLQDKKYRRLGETRLRQANVRIIAATNVKLEQAVEEEKFRKDLFFRLRVCPVEVPPLHARPEDIEVLLGAFVDRSSQRYGLARIELTSAAVLRLQEYNWPGNIRELENCVDYLTCLQLDRPIQPRDLPLLKSNMGPDANGNSIRSVVDEYLNQVVEEARGFQDAKRQLIDNFEQQYLEQALRSNDGNVSAAARMSSKNRRSFLELMRKHNIDPNGFRPRRRSSAESIMDRVPVNQESL